MTVKGCGEMSAIKVLLTVAVLCLAMMVFGALPKGTIECEGLYAGHLQGVATDGESIYWSFTVKLVRSDLKGHVLKEIDVPSHHGDLCIVDDKVFVAVNRGSFNQENKGKSMICAYDRSTLCPKGSWPIDMPHGAGGMTAHDGHYFVIGGLPATHEQNYVYEYDGNFRLVGRHELKTGFTLMGIQTAHWFNGRFLFGIYGGKGNPSGVLECPADLSSFVRRVTPGNVGILDLCGVLYAANSRKQIVPGIEKLRHSGSISPCPQLLTGEPYVPVKNGGMLRLFCPQDGTNGWFDCGYALTANGYRPLTAYAEAFVPAKKIPAVIPAVGIGGSCSYSAPDMVRGVRRAAQQDELLAFHILGTAEEAAHDEKLKAALSAVLAEAEKLGVRVLGFNR